MAVYSISRATSSDPTCDVVLVPNVTSSPMFTLQPAAEAIQLSLSNVSIRDSSGASAYQNTAIFSKPAGAASVSILLTDVAVSRMVTDSRTLSLVYASGFTDITISDSTLSWPSSGTTDTNGAQSGGTFHLSGGASLTLNNTLLQDAGLLGTSPTSGQLLYATGSGTSVTLTDSVVLGATQGAAASLVQLEGGATLAVNQTLLRAGSDTTSEQLIYLAGASTASLTDVLVVGESGGDLTHVLQSGESASGSAFNLTRTTVYADFGITALDAAGSTSFDSAVFTGAGTLPTASTGCQVNDPANTLSLGTLGAAVTELNDLLEGSATDTTVCWSGSEICIQDLPLWPTLCSATWAEGGRPAGFLTDDGLWWNNSVLDRQVAYRGDTWYRYYLAGQEPDQSSDDSGRASWVYTPCYDATDTTSACATSTLAELAEYRPDSWLEAQEQTACELEQPKPGDPDDPDDPDDPTTSSYKPSGPACGERTAAALTVLPGLGLLLALRRRALAPLRRTTR